LTSIVPEVDLKDVRGCWREWVRASACQSVRRARVQLYRYLLWRCRWGLSTRTSCYRRSDDRIKRRRRWWRKKARSVRPDDRYSQSGDCGENAAVEWFGDVRRSDARLEI